MVKQNDQFLNFFLCGVWQCVVQQIQRVQGLISDCLFCFRFCGVRFREVLKTFQGVLLLLSDAHKHICLLFCGGGWESRYKRIRQQLCFHLSSVGGLSQYIFFCLKQFFFLLSLYVLNLFSLRLVYNTKFRESRWHG